MKHVVRISGHDVPAALAGPPAARRLLLVGGAHSAALVPASNGAHTLTLDGAEHRVFIAGTDDLLFIHIDGEVFELAVQDPLAVYASKAVGAAALQTRAPMPGSVVAVPVAVGDTVQAGDTLVIIESMKLEVSLRAECAGTVSAVGCSVGATFDKDAVLVTLTAAAGGAP